MYIYQYRNYLGNTRVSFGRNNIGALEIVDANDYYPFGMNHLKTGHSFYGQGSYKNYKYNGKELQETSMYDYAFNNPIFYNDLRNTYKLRILDKGENVRIYGNPNATGYMIFNKVTEY
ncbi:hypothetical protein [Chryseobacterium sp. SIMBA_028]|uniref:hypothetical protein n=1 Tax=Chryseobacterium sp. SIMBA_028 TaxID=3085771 RepID=UPI0039798275